MRKFKTVVALILSFTLCLGMVACGTDNVGENTSSDVATVTEAEISTATDVAETTTEDKSVTEEKTTEKKTTEEKTTEVKTEEKTTEEKTTEEKTTEEKKTTETKKTETTQAPTTEAPRTTEAPKTTQAPTTEAPAPAPYETGSEVVAATCESGGYTVHYMSDGSSYTTDNTATLGHSWEEYGHTEEVEVKTAVDCRYRCRKCGYEGSDETHWDTCSGTSTYIGDEYEYSTEMQYIRDGYKCTRCGATK